MHSLTKIIGSLSLLFIINVTNAQYFFKYSHIPVTFSGTAYSHAFTGGFNGVTVSKIDLNLDGIDDLLLYDKSAYRTLPYIWTTQGWMFAPEYASRLPETNLWLQTLDYNGDGKTDFFTFQNGVKVYKNTSSATQLQFTYVKNLFNATVSGGSVLNIVYDFYGIPGFADVDGDGDMDFFNYKEFPGGMEFYRNMSAETGNGADSLYFQKELSCWGRFIVNPFAIENGIYQCDKMIETNRDCRGFGGINDNLRMMHGGSFLKVTDLNQDGKFDMMMGDLSCSRITLLTNTGTNLAGNVTKVVYGFPENHPIDIKYLPGVYFEDVNNDGKTDLLASPFLANNENNEVNFLQSLWLYTNSGTNTAPIYNFFSEDFLQNQALDIGENASPALIDIDGDGDLDLLTGQGGAIQSNGFYAKLKLFENTGTATVAAFNLVNNDYLQLSEYQFPYFHPQVFDINNDGKPDLYSVCQDSLGYTKLFYWLNNSTFAGAANFNGMQALELDFFTSTVNLNLRYSFNEGDKVTFIRKNGDFLALLGRSIGGLTLYKYVDARQGFVLQKTQILGFSDEFINGNLHINFFKNGNTDTLTAIAINDFGKLMFFKNINNLLTDAISPQRSVVLDLDTNFLIQTHLGTYNHLAVGDLTADGFPDVIVGGRGGGLMYLENISKKYIGNPEITVPGPIDPPTTVNPSVNEPTTANQSKSIIKVYPNPVTNGVVFVECDTRASVQLINTFGTPLTAKVELLPQQKQFLTTSHLSKGVYFLKFTTSDNTIYYRLAVP